MSTRILAVLLASLVAGCSSNNRDATDPTFAPGQITVTLPKTTYSTSDLSPSSGQGVRATLGNSADQPFYSMIGDAFNGAAEQSPLFVAVGSDASIEREEGSAWVAVTSAHLVEGVKVVSLLPGKTYELIALASPVTAGRYRIVVAYRDAPNSSPTRRAVSAIFEVR
jgi:hypothetical protein